MSRPELLRDGSDKAFRHFVHDTLAFSARIQEVRGRLGGLIGLTSTQYTILITIAHLHGPAGVGINAVAEHVHLSGAFVTIEVNKLVARKLVSKETSLEDRRRVNLTITAKARALLDELTVVQAPVNDALFADLTAEEFDMLRAIMTRLVDTADRSLHLFGFLAPDGRGTDFT
ncbi:MarR family winged helix-turn-helix transcriptional regulator [Phreatobacter stygius]|uniref:MarR family winged helix-turn-helix transcriptional regulator n=1 Tax=Phreatobacter stygius TaxID=1940610 RepID=UPI001FE3897B|nr:MarR family winged helix-turn-helix transcriptional regulator [Phreatobacter stygius]